VADTIRLEVGASPSVLPIVRMIVGGVGARLEFSLDDLADINVAVEELLGAAQGFGEGPRWSLLMELADDRLTITAGPFRSAGLRRQIVPDEGDSGFCLGTVFAQVVQSVEVCGVDGDCYSISFTKKGPGAT
jgi:hypothetical protein